jgi:hypothetical protein
VSKAVDAGLRPGAAFVHFRPAAEGTADGENHLCSHTSPDWLTGCIYGFARSSKPVRDRLTRSFRIFRALCKAITSIRSTVPITRKVPINRKTQLRETKRYS